MLNLIRTSIIIKLLLFSTTFSSQAMINGYESVKLNSFSSQWLTNITDSTTSAKNSYNQNNPSPKVILESKEAEKRNYDNLWKSALEYLKNRPLHIVDKQTGYISTDWFISINDRNKRLKIKIYVTEPKTEENVLEDLKVEVFVKKQNERGEWQDEGMDEILAERIKKSIIAKDTNQLSKV
jgi:hypothetical protein